MRRSGAGAANRTVAARQVVRGLRGRDVRVEAGRHPQESAVWVSLRPGVV